MNERIVIADNTGFLVAGSTDGLRRKLETDPQELNRLNPLCPEAAMDQLKAGVGTQFDEAVVTMLEQILREQGELDPV